MQENHLKRLYTFIKCGKVSLSCLYTPGHAPGHVALYTDYDDVKLHGAYTEEINNRPVLIAGDALFYNGIGRTDLPLANYAELIDSIKEKSICIFLEIKMNNLVQRLTNNLKSRPLLKNVDLKEKLENMKDKRTKKYEQAHIIISVDGLTIPDIVRRIINNLKYHGKNKRDKG